MVVVVVGWFVFGVSFWRVLKSSVWTLPSSTHGRHRFGNMLCVAGTRLVASFRKIFGRGGRVARWATSPPSPPSPPSAPSPHKADQTRPTKQGRPNKADQTKPTKQGQSKQGTVKVLALCARMDRSSATRTRKIQNKNENPHAQTTPKNENHKGQIKQLKGEGRKRGHF